MFFLEKIFGKTFYVNLWIAISLGLAAQVIGFTKYDGYLDLYWIIMKDVYLYFNLYPSLNELSLELFYLLEQLQFLKLYIA